jgi:alkylation response protein AidB-like acyl-CoA dehydrogenase
MDHEEYVPMDVVHKAAEAGLFGIPFPVRYGGADGGEIGYCVMMQEVCRWDASFGTIVGAHVGLGAIPIYLDGSEQLKQKYLRPLAQGHKLAAFALTETGAGSDAAGIRMTATREGDSFFLDGSKMWITNGPIADIIIVLANTDPSLGPRGGQTCFVVEKEWEGFSTGAREDKMGLHGSPTSVLNFDGVRVPQENVLGTVGLGFVTFMKTLDVGRIAIGAAALGGSERALEWSVRWAKARHQFGQAIAHQQSVHFMIADMATEIEALRSLIYRTAWMVDQGLPFTKEAGMCKLFGSEVGSRCIDRAVQIHGALGVSRDFPGERAFRDARVSEIFEGTNEIQRIVIASQIFREAGVRISP